MSGTQVLRTTLALAAAMSCVGGSAQAEQLYDRGNWSALASDQRASEVGDVITVVIAESARATSRLQNGSSRRTDIGGGIRAGGLDEDASLDFGGSYSGRGEVTRSDQFVARMSAQVIEVFENGDLLIEGHQQMLINDEETRVTVRGRIRPVDIQDGNFVLSSRLAGAQINYDGEGFVSRSARPGLLNRIFSFLGIG